MHFIAKKMVRIVYYSKFMIGFFIEATRIRAQIAVKKAGNLIRYSVL